MTTFTSQLSLKSCLCVEPQPQARQTNTNLIMQIDITSEYLASQHLSQTFPARFWKKVNKDGPIPIQQPNLGKCWVWAGGVSSRGYGSMRRGKRIDGDIRAHRASWLIHKGEIPAGFGVLHRCDVPLCVNPDHLFLGTSLDNTHDMMSKGRCKHRENHPRHILNWKQVMAIKQEYRFREITQKMLAERYGVDRTTVGKIIAGVNWKE